MYVHIVHMKFLLLINKTCDYNYATLEFIYKNKVLENAIQQKFSYLWGVKYSTKESKYNPPIKQGFLHMCTQIKCRCTLWYEVMRIFIGQFVYYMNILILYLLYSQIIFQYPIFSITYRILNEILFLISHMCLVECWHTLCKCRVDGANIPTGELII